MTNEEYAAKVFNALSSDVPFTTDEFQITDRGGNVARLITKIWRDRLSGSKTITSKTVYWNDGEVAFKNFASNIRFWTKVTVRDLEDEDGLRVWVCSSIDNQTSALHVWVIPISQIRNFYENFPEDAQGRWDLKIDTGEQDGWTFHFNNPPEVAPELDFHHQLHLSELEAFQQACAADERRRQEIRGGQPPPPPVRPGGEPKPDPGPSLPEITGSNKIYFGPPGTGKSFRLHNELEDEIRGGRVMTVTFHPEYTYADFVGSYHPTMAYGGDEQYYDANNRPMQIKGRPAVIYSFVPGPLVQMICRAMLESNNHFYLIIEEINRGNCAAIFGDLFHLLDRHHGGESEYSVRVEADLNTYIQQQLSHEISKDEDLLRTKKRFEREGLFIPSNLSIYATMNTSDQSLYPMDSAMKRRWEMKYVPIDYKEAKDRHADILGYGQLNWGEVLLHINKEIVKYTHSDDKQLGQWFVRGNTINASTFRDKVLSYLWFDVFRHSPQDLFDLGEKPYSYESLVTTYEQNQPVFKRGVLDDPTVETEEPAND